MNPSRVFFLSILILSFVGLLLNSSWHSFSSSSSSSSSSSPSSSPSSSVQSHIHSPSRCFPRYCRRDAVHHHFVIFAQQRSGTHWVKELLGDYPAFLMDDEILLPVTRPLSINRTDLALLRFYQKNANGFILHYNQAKEAPWFLKRLKQDLFGVVFLRRTDLLAAFISNHVQYNSKGLPWHCKSEECKQHNANVSITVDPKHLLQWLKTRAADWINQEKLIQASGLQYITVDYEQLLTGTRVQICRILTFLGCSCEYNFISQTEILKLHDAPKPTFIRNWNVVVRTLNQTEFAWMLND